MEKELTKMTDSFTDDLFVPDFVGSQTIIFPMSRLVLDPERFLNDDQEIMSELGMGVIYTRTSDGQVLRNSPAIEERKKLINRYYRPQHTTVFVMLTAKPTFKNLIYKKGKELPSR